MTVTHKILMIISLPVLTFGWLFAAYGMYYLGAVVFDYPTTTRNTALGAIMAFAFSFGTISFASIIAAKTNFALNSNIRQLYKYSIIMSAILFLGYTLISVARAFLDLTFGA